MKIFYFIVLFVFLINLSSASDRKSTDLDVNNIEKVRSFIEEMVFIIKEHSSYALAHPDNIDNSIRHLKHTCHAINPNLVNKRPMPAPEIGLHKALEIYFNKTGGYKKGIYAELQMVTNKAINLCMLNLHSNNLQELNDLGNYMNFQYSNFYNILKNE